MQSQLGKACTIKNSVFIRLLAYVVLMRLQQNKKPEQRMTTLSGKPVTQTLVFLREREIVHFQRFGEALAYVQKQLDSDNYYRYNPAFDK